MKGFIEILDVKGVVHHFRLDDLRSYRDGYFQYEPQGGFITHMKATDIEDCIENAVATPAPDALVEKIKALRQANEFVRAYIAATHKNHLDYTFLSPLEGSNIKDGMEMAYALEGRLNDALADHEKAGG